MIHINRYDIQQVMHARTLEKLKKQMQPADQPTCDAMASWIITSFKLKYENLVDVEQHTHIHHIRHT